MGYQKSNGTMRNLPLATRLQQALLSVDVASYLPRNTGMPIDEGISHSPYGLEILPQTSTIDIKGRTVILNGDANLQLLYHNVPDNGYIQFFALGSRPVAYAELADLGGALFVQQISGIEGAYPLLAGIGFERRLLRAIVNIGREAGFRQVRVVNPYELPEFSEMTPPKISYGELAHPLIRRYIWTANSLGFKLDGNGEMFKDLTSQKAPAHVA